MAFRLTDPERENIDQEEIITRQPEQPLQPRQQARESLISGLKKTGDITESVGHQLASAGAEVISSVVGTPGNLLSFVNDVIARPLTEAITNKQSLPYEKTFLGKVLPTSSQIRKDFDDSLPYLKPRNKYENFTNDFFGTAALMLFPGGQAQAGKVRDMDRYSRALLKSLGVNLAGDVTEQLTGSKTAGDWTRIGSLFLFNAVDRPGTRQLIRSLNNRADNALAQAGNPTVNANRLTTNLNQVRNRLTRGTLAPSEQAVVNDIDAVLEHVNNGQIPVENLRSSLRSINENIGLSVRSAAGREGRLRARRLYSNVTRPLQIELEGYGRINPEFGIPYNEAQTAYGAIEQSNAVARTVDKISGSDISKSGLLHSIGGAFGAAGAKLGLLTPQTLLGGAAYQAGKLFYRMARSPVLRRHYLNAIRYGAQENAPAMAKEMEKMEKIVEKQDKTKKPYRISKENSD